MLCRDRLGLLLLGRHPILAWRQRQVSGRNESSLNSDNAVGSCRTEMRAIVDVADFISDSRNLPFLPIGSEDIGSVDPFHTCGYKKLL